MAYFTKSSEYLFEKPVRDADNDPTKENLIAGKPSVPPPDQSNSSKEDKTNATKQGELKTMITKTSIAMELGNINHNLDVLKQNIQENAEKFNKSTILISDVGKKFSSTRTKNDYRVICKIGYGGSSLVWLIIDMKSKEFKAAKVFKHEYGILEIEKEILQQTSNHPNILRYYEQLGIKWGKKGSFIGIYEPLGKDLNMLMKEASKYGGLSVPVIKKVAKHVLSALKAIHELKVIHSDIKPNNIATCVSQLSLRREFKKIVELMKSGQSISRLRMVCQKDAEIDMNEITKYFEEELEKVSKLEIKDVTELIFKLIDFGNAMKEGEESSTGTPGFRPPEYFFGSPLLPSHDIWSLGVTIVVLFTNKRFLEYGNGSKLDEITALRNMFGLFSRRHFKGFKDPDGYKTKFTSRKYLPEDAVDRINKFLRIKLDKIQMDDDHRNKLIDFLLQMLNTVPSERKSAAELLLHPWLNDDMARGDDPNEHNLYPEDDDHGFTNKFSATLIPQRKQKEANANESGTPLDTAVASSHSYCKDTSETSWNDDLSINAQMVLDNAVFGHEEVENYYSDNETVDTVDSDLDETEEDSNETISEFGSGESYIEDDASYAPHMESFSEDDFADLLL